MPLLAIVEDVETIRNELIHFFETNGYDVTALTNFDHVTDDILRINADCVLLDLGLPGIDGHLVCREIRKVSQVPIIIVTSRDSDMDEMIAMNLGADGYITKPFNMQVLMAHINRIIARENRSDNTQYLEFHGFLVDPSRGEMIYNNVREELTKNELKILIYLLKNVNKIVERDELAEYMWNDAVFVDDNTLTVNINRLRKKLENLGIPPLIETKRGMGYVIYDTY